VILFRAHELAAQSSFDSRGYLSPLRGSLLHGQITQGSQSLTLGLTLVAASQLTDLRSPDRKPRRPPFWRQRTHHDGLLQNCVKYVVWANL